MSLTTHSDSAICQKRTSVGGTPTVAVETTALPQKADEGWGPESHEIPAP